ncbi:MAG: amidohydrolase family protein [Gammaproteobacteria bacterium]
MSAIRSFPIPQDVAAIRARLDHPIIDADGHLIEIMPMVYEIVGEMFGQAKGREYRDYMRSRHHPEVPAFTAARVFWGLPEENTLDRMTVTLPRLMRARMDEMGMDFALLYPTSGLTVMGYPQEEMRRMGTRALNTYYARLLGEFKDRMTPVAVIPTYTPQEAIEELEYAVRTLGLKCAVMSAVIPRTHRPDGTAQDWLDTLGHDSLYDYDPLWAKCVELGVVPAFHAIGYGWGSRFSKKNYVYNHLGNFAAAQEAACRSLFMGGVPKRFPNLRFSFLEGGVGWAAQLYSDIHGHYDKRNKDAIQMFDPRHFDVALCNELFDAYGPSQMSATAREQYVQVAGMYKGTPPPDPSKYDDFAESRIQSADDIVAVFRDQFYFGCEADDPMNALAFKPEMLPFRLRMNAMFASDIGHWDVPDLRGVLPEAWELVEDGHIGTGDFRDFTFGNVARMLTAVNPKFFDGTAVADAVRGGIG